MKDRFPILLIAHAISAILFVGWPWWSEKTKSSSHTLTAYDVSGWAENIHSGPLPRYPFVVELLVYIEVATVHYSQHYNIFYLVWPLCHYALVIHLYLNACYAAAWTHDDHNIVSPSATRIIALVCMQLSGLAWFYKLPSASLKRD